MANDRVIAIRIQADGTAEVISDLDRVGKTAAGMGEGTAVAANKGSSAVKGLGFAARGLAQEFGMGVGMSRFFSSETIALARSFGVAGMALGGFTIAALAAYKIYEHFAEVENKLRDEIIKNGTSLANEALGMEQNRVATEANTRQKYQLYLITREVAKRELEQAIEAQTRKIEDQVETINKGGPYWNQFLRALNMVNIFSKEFYETGTLSEKWASQTAKALQQPRNELERMVLSLAKMRLQMSELAQPSLKLDEFTGRAKEILETTQKAALEASRAGLRAYTDMLLQGDTLVGRWEAGLVRLQQRTKALAAQQAESGQNVAAWEAGLQALKDKSYYADEERTIKWIQLQEQVRQIEQQTWEYRINSVTSGLQAIDAITKGKYKGIFYAIQGMNAAMAIIHGEAAAAAAIAPPPVGLGPVAGAGLAMWARIQGYMAAAAIMAQAFSGTGGGGGAIGTYSANPSTGLPNNTYSADYGTGWRPGEGQDRRGGDIYNITIQGDVYPQDENAFKNKVNTAVQENIADGGKTKTTIEKYAYS